MKKLIPHIRIENCKEELDFYQKVFGGEIKHTQLADGIEMFKGQEGKYIHAELHINEQCTIFFADTLVNKFINGSNILLGPELDSEEEITRIYYKLAEDGEIQMELQDTFWGAKHAIVKDRNGVSWELNYTKE
ncbi:VOC family protein [Virgibacillus profundi]|uniref:VOC family protein n=1 Tax=Virgibacillus profundi TaxID=2024555 RepID=A0A2A2IFH1_9BACI|nr:VOC family protein [Virgibacillus profundi]PAV30519.1 VOC family protein [Virgibacillus profundi]PXY54691.1 VOC family protein [Virgibacillus profundi]